MNRFNRQLPWSVLQTEWLDVPIGQDAGRPNPTWMAFSESVDVCLQGVSRHVGRCVDDRDRLERIVTEVFVDNLDVLVSHLNDHDKLDRLLTAADLLIERSQAPRRVKHARAENEA